MKWKSLISPVKNMNADKVKKLMAERIITDYQLIDVRQPQEYEREHLSGAELIPLIELPSRIPALDKDKLTIVY